MNFRVSPTLISPSVILTAATLGLEKNFTTSPILCSPIANPPSYDDLRQKPVP
jgi:hypothetical protein